MPETLSTLVRPAVTKRPGAFSRLLSAYCEGIVGYFVRRSAIASLRELDDHRPRALPDRNGGPRFHHSFRPSEDVMIASSAAMRPRPDGGRRTTTAEAAAWS